MLLLSGLGTRTGDADRSFSAMLRFLAEHGGYDILRDVLEGARATIAHARPPLLLELLSGTQPDPGALTAEICASFGYEAFIVQQGENLPALPAIAALGKNTTWGTEIESRNVLFLPQTMS